MIKGVDMILVFVTDMERSLAWYRDVLELPVRFSAAEFALLDTGGVPLALHSGAEPCDHHGSHGTLACLLVDDYAASKATLEARGCHFGFENETDDRRFGTLEDPDGNSLQIVGMKRADESLAQRT